MFLTLKSTARFLLPWCLLLAVTPVAVGQDKERDTAMAAYEKTEQLFEEPGAAYRGKPFWSWNGDLEKDELMRQIEVIKEMGFGGFFMHSRTGLATEYLGDEWFEYINACADAAERLGLEAWLYDEDRWPSGSAGGMATKDPQYRMRYLQMLVLEAKDYAWDESYLAAFSCDLDGINYANCERLGADSPASAWAKKTVLAFRVVLMDEHSFYNGNTYLDTMNREATEHFIELTHEKYKEKCGDRLGRSIQGIFTDEPHRGMVMCKNVSQGSLTNSEYCTAWTDSLPETFQERFGHDLIEQLPSLFLRPEGERILPVKWEYMELLQQLFLENWAKPIQDWCKENNMILTGHVLHEDSLGSQAIPNGSLMRYYEYMDYPGVDVLSEGNRNYWIVKQLSSAARQLGKPWMLSELYGCTGWQFDFESHKTSGDWQSLFGINVRCPHLSWYTMEGESKRDYPASIFHQSTWYPDYDAVETYFSRLQAVMSQGKADCRILVLNPIESSWAQIYKGWGTWLSAIAPEVQKLDKQYRDIFHWLSGAQLDFDYGDEDMLRRLASVVDGDGAPRMRVGEAEYTTVVMAGMETVRTSTLDLLDAFIKAGGTVIAVGDAPAYVDALPSGRAKALARRMVQTPFKEDAFAQACAKAAGRPVSVEKDGAPAKEIFCQTRKDDGVRYVMALNTNRSKGFENCLVQIEGHGSVEEWNSLTGERLRVPATQKDGFLEFEADFPIAGEKLYVLRPTVNTALPVLAELEEVRRDALEGPYAYTLDEPNICVLDDAAYQVDGGAWQDAQEILRVDRALRDTFALPHRGGEMLQPWFSGKTEKEVKAQVALRFEFSIADMPKKLGLLMERPEHFEIVLNGRAIPSDTAQGWMIDNSLERIALPTDALKRGVNAIELRLGFHEDINLESLYLTGNFGVELQGTKRILTTLPEKLKAGTVTDQGLPFYSGRIRYQIPLPKKTEADARAVLTTPEFEGACIQVYGANQERRTIPWAPYEADITSLTPPGGVIDVEVVLTRRNTFGPLHQIPLRAGGYGPGNWVTSGKGWSDDYMLWPAGLLKAPEISWRK
jgi:hypothetical protein